jgi:hypothetical protein
VKLNSHILTYLRIIIFKLNESILGEGGTRAGACAKWHYCLPLYGPIYTYNEHISRKSRLMKLKQKNSKALSNEQNYEVGWSQLTQGSSIWFRHSRNRYERTDTDCMYSVSSVWIIPTLTEKKPLTYDP